jgi:hypothetical protein
MDFLSFDVILHKNISFVQNLHGADYSHDFRPIKVL